MGALPIEYRVVGAQRRRRFTGRDLEAVEEDRLSGRPYTSKGLEQATLLGMVGIGNLLYVPDRRCGDPGSIESLADLGHRQLASPPFDPRLQLCLVATTTLIGSETFVLDQLWGPHAVG